jgi:hypothetical protein
MSASVPPIHPAPVPAAVPSAAPWRDPLTPGHRHELEAGSGIAPEIIAERGYRSVTADQVAQAHAAGPLAPGFTDPQCRDGLLIPIDGVTGARRAYQLKPDQPRRSQGKAVKYEWMTRMPMCLDVPRRVLPHLADPGTPLWITEGAKKVDSALSHGLEAVIGLAGVWNWLGRAGGKRSSDTTPLADWDAVVLRGRDVVIAFDSDCMTKPSVRLALERLAAFLANRGATVGYCLMPHLPDGAKCGLDDFFVAGGTLEDLDACVVETLPEPEPDPFPAAVVPDVVWVHEVAAQEIDWLWQGWIPRRMLTILGGYGGDGKSTVMASLIARFTTGGRLPDDTVAPATSVLMLSAEDDIAYAIRPRLETHGADITRVVVMKGTRGEGEDGPTRWLDLRRDVAAMEGLVRAHDVGLIVIDPLSSYLPQADRNSEGDIRDALQPLMGLMERTGVAVVGIMHVGKSAENRRASQRLLGSTAFTALARSVLMVADLPEEQQPEDAATGGTQKVLQVVKSNYAIAPPPRLFRRPLDRAIQWGGESAVGVEECLAGTPGKRGPAPEDANDAEALLREMLAEGPVEVVEVTRLAKQLGLSERTLRRVKKTLGIVSVKQAYDGPWMWSMSQGVRVSP